MALRKTIRVGDAWCCKSALGHDQIFIVKEILQDKVAKGTPVVLTDITGLFRSAVSRRTYFGMVKKANPLTQTEVSRLRDLLSESLEE